MGRACESHRNLLSQLRRGHRAKPNQHAIVLTQRREAAKAQTERRIGSSCVDFRRERRPSSIRLLLRLCGLAPLRETPTGKAALYCESRQPQQSTSGEALCQVVPQQADRQRRQEQHDEEEGNGCQRYHPPATHVVPLRGGGIAAEPPASKSSGPCRLAASQSPVGSVPGAATRLGFPSTGDREFRDAPPPAIRFTPHRGGLFPYRACPGRLAAFCSGFSVLAGSVLGNVFRFLGLAGLRSHQAQPSFSHLLLAAAMKCVFGWTQFPDQEAFQRWNEEIHLGIELHDGTPSEIERASRRCSPPGKAASFGRSLVIGKAVAKPPQRHSFANSCDVAGRIKKDIYPALDHGGRIQEAHFLVQNEQRRRKSDDWCKELPKRWQSRFKFAEFLRDFHGASTPQQEFG